MSDDRNQILNDQEEATRIFLDGRQVGIWTAIPGIIESVDFDTMTCEVQPALQAIIVDENGEEEPTDLPLLVDVPIVFPKAGGFLITFPMAAGDEVLVVFSSRCIDAWWQNGGVQQAMEARMHDLSDGFAIPGPYSQPKFAPVAAVSSTDVQLRTEDGTAFVSIDPTGKVKLTSGSEIDITAPVVNITGTVTVTGALACGALTCASIGTSGSGAATIGGSLTAASVVAGGTNLHTHTHSGVTTGGGNTGPPV